MMRLAAGLAQAQQDFSKVEMKTADLGDDTYMLEGQGEKITLIVGTDGVITFDTQFATPHEKGQGRDCNGH